MKWMIFVHREIDKIHNLFIKWLRKLAIKWFNIAITLQNSIVFSLTDWQKFRILLHNHLKFEILLSNHLTKIDFWLISELVWQNVRLSPVIVWQNLWFYFAIIWWNSQFYSNIRWKWRFVSTHVWWNSQFLSTVYLWNLLSLFHDSPTKYVILLNNHLAEFTISVQMLDNNLFTVTWWSLQFFSMTDW